MLKKKLAHDALPAKNTIPFLPCKTLFQFCFYKKLSHFQMSLHGFDSYFNEIELKWKAIFLLKDVSKTELVVYSGDLGNGSDEFIDNFAAKNNAVVIEIDVTSESGLAEAFRLLKDNGDKKMVVKFLGLESKPRYHHKMDFSANSVFPRADKKSEIGLLDGICFT